MSSFYRTGVWFLKGLREYTKSGFQNAAKNFESLDEINVSDRAFMITGANSGIGKATALEIAKRGGTVYLVCRDVNRGEEARKEIVEATNNENVFLRVLDMSKPKDIYEFVQAFVTANQPLHVLVNNAGCMVNTRTETAEGLEMNFATNTLGTFILTTQLIPHLEKFDNPRVITVSSGGMLLQRLNTDDLQSEKVTSFDGSMAYAQNKRQQVVMTERWAELYPGKIHFSSMHPGWADTPAVQSSMPDFHRRMEGKLRSPEEGADTVLWLSISPSATSAPNGSFFQDREAVSKHLPLAWTPTTALEDQVLMDKLKELAKRFEPEQWHV